MKYRIAIITNKRIIGKNFKTKDEVDTYLLGIMEKEEVKRYRIMDKSTGKIIEDEKGVRNKDNAK